jgi:hypothetical protein
MALELSTSSWRNAPALNSVAYGTIFSGNKRWTSLNNLPPSPRNCQTPNFPITAPFTTPKASHMSRACRSMAGSALVQQPVAHGLTIRGEKWMYSVARVSRSSTLPEKIMEVLTLALRENRRSGHGCDLGARSRLCRGILAIPTGPATGYLQWAWRLSSIQNSKAGSHWGCTPRSAAHLTHRRGIFCLSSLAQRPTFRQYLRRQGRPYLKNWDN